MSALEQAAAGVHLLAEFWGAEVITDEAHLDAVLRGAAAAAGAEVLGSAFHSFSPQGITGILLLAESHLSLHSWPELDYTAVDVFTCGLTTCPEAAVEHLERVLRPAAVEVRRLRRGLAPGERVPGRGARDEEAT